MKLLKDAHIKFDEIRLQKEEGVLTLFFCYDKKAMLSYSVSEYDITRGNTFAIYGLDGKIGVKFLDD